MKTAILPGVLLIGILTTNTLYVEAAEGSQLKVVEVGKELIVIPHYLKDETPNVSISSHVPLVCSKPSCELTQDGGAFFLELQDKGGGRSLRIPVLPAKGASTPWLPWLAASSTFLLVGISFAHWRSVRNGYLSGPYLSEFQGELFETIGQLRRILSQPVPPPRRINTSVAPVDARPRVASSDKTNGFIDAVEGWCRFLSPIDVPNEVLKGLAAMKGARSSANGPLPPDTATKIARVALKHSDTHIDPDFEDRDLQAALQRLLDEAGLRLINPRAGAAFDEDLHEWEGRTTGAPSHQRGRVSQVVFRGLSRENKVFCKAGVKVYD